MKVYGVYVSDYESGHFETPFYDGKDKAIDKAKELLGKAIEETGRMQAFTKVEFGNSDYKNWKQESPCKWIGGYCEYESIEVVEIEVK